MDTEHFDQLARLAGGRTRRAALRFAAAAALGGAGVAAAARGDEVSAKKKRPPDRCSNVAVCNQAYVACGTTAGNGGDCSCNRAVEKNTICVNSLDSCDGLVPCKSTKQCRKKLGFHFFCQQQAFDAQGRACGCGQVCVTECDNPNP